MKNTIFSKSPRQIRTMYNTVHYFFSFFSYCGTANWYKEIDQPTLWQKFYKWRISPKTAWRLASGYLRDKYTKCPKCKKKGVIKYRDGKQCTFCMYIE